MAGEQPEQSGTSEPTEEQTVSSGGATDGLSFDERVEEVRELRETVTEAEPGSSILFDERDESPTNWRRRVGESIGATALFDGNIKSVNPLREMDKKERRRRAASGKDFAMRHGTVPTNRTGGSGLGDDLDRGGQLVDDQLNFTRSVSNRELEKKLHVYGRRLARVEEKLDEVLNAVDDEPGRPVGGVLQDLVDDNIGVRQAAFELGWSHQKVRNVIHEIEREDLNDSPFMGADELREHLRERMQDLVGTGDLGEANRRFEVLEEWRYEDE